MGARRLEGMRSSADQPLLKAVLWDMDGTIVDTEPYWIEAEHELVAAHGGRWSHEQAMQLVGQSLVFSARVLQKAGVSLEIREIIDTLTAQLKPPLPRAVAPVILGGPASGLPPSILVTQRTPATQLVQLDADRLDPRELPGTCQ